MATEDKNSGCGVTFKALLIGGGASIFIGVAVPYSNMIIKGTVLAHNFSTPVALFIFFILVLFLNPLLHLFHRGLALSRGELAVVYIMAMVATSIPRSASPNTSCPSPRGSTTSLPLRTTGHP